MNSTQPPVQNSNPHTDYPRIVSYFLLFIISIIPLLFDSRSMDSILIKRFAIGCAVVYIFILWRRTVIVKNMKCPFTIIEIPIMLLIVWETCSVCVMPYRAAGIWELLRRIPAYLMAVVVSHIIMSKRDRLRFFWVSVIVTVIVCGYGLLQLMGYDPIGWDRSIDSGIFSTMGHPNFLAAYLLLQLSIALVLFIHVQKPWQQHLCLGITVLIFISLLFTKSKGAVLGLGLGILFLFVVAVKRYSFRIRMGVALLCICSAALTLGFFSSHIKRSQQFRIETWKNTARIVLANPLWGTGLGRFPIEFSLYRSPDYMRRFRHAINLEHAHQEYLETLSETGIIGFLLFLFPVLVTGNHAINLIRANESGVKHWAPALFMSSIVAVLGQNLVCINLRNATIFFYFWMLMGLLCSEDTGILTLGKYERFFNFVRMGVFFFTTFCLMIGLPHESRRLSSERTRFTATQEPLGSRQATTLLRKAIYLDPRNLFIRYDLGAQLYASKAYTEAIKVYKELLEYDPAHQWAQISLAQTYAETGDYDNAIAWAEAAQKNADTESIRFSIAHFYDMAGKYPQAVGAYTEAYSLAADFTRFQAEIERTHGIGVDQIKPTESREITQIQDQSAVRIGIILVRNLKAGASQITREYAQLRELASEYSNLGVYCGEYLAYHLLERDDLAEQTLNRLTQDNRKKTIFFNYLSALCRDMGEPECQELCERELQNLAQLEELP